MPNSHNVSPPTGSTAQKSPLQFIADEFWSDFEQNRPIDGGVAYEAELRKCNLNGSIASVCRLDAFLSYVNQKNRKPPDVFMQEQSSRNLVLFIGFYIGKIVARAWQSHAHWLGQNELASRYGHLKIHANNPFHFVALGFIPYSNKKSFESSWENAKVSERLFFVLEPVAVKIFGAKLKMPAVLGDKIAPTLLDAVLICLPEGKKENAKEAALLEQSKLEETPLFALKPKATPSSNSKTKVAQIAASSPAARDVMTDSITDSTTRSAPSINMPLDNASVTKNPNGRTSSGANGLVKSQSDIRQDEFKELRADLAQMYVSPTDIQADTDAMFGRANKVLGQIDKAIAKRLNAGIALEDVELTEQEIQIRDRALTVIRKAMNQGHSRAMLRLAIHYFLGEGVKKEPQKGFDLVYTAANQGDAVAQRQLSRLYYQGIGCVQDMEAGKQWLQKAADNGHEESIELINNWGKAQTAISEQRIDATTDQRYIIIIGLVILIGLIIAIII